MGRCSRGKVFCKGFPLKVVPGPLSHAGSLNTCAPCEPGHARPSLFWTRRVACRVPLRSLAHIYLQLGLVDAPAILQDHPNPAANTRHIYNQITSFPTFLTCNIYGVGCRCIVSPQIRRVACKRIHMKFEKFRGLFRECALHLEFGLQLV